jgi:hypothetical protein
LADRQDSTIAYNAVVPFFSLATGLSMSQLEQLKQYTTIVADTGDFQAMKAYARRMPPPIPR